MKSEIMYIELKTGYQDNGPAWIGRVRFSQTGQTIYFNNKAFRKGSSHYYGNYRDSETQEAYWISGIKKNGQDRHWAGSGKIMIERKVIDEYLQLTGLKALDGSKFTIVDGTDNYPIERHYEMENE